MTRAARSDADANVRMVAVGALGQCAEELNANDPVLRQVVETLIVAVEKDNSVDVREVSVHYLQRLAPNDERALRALVRATADEVESVRRKATNALQEMGREDLTKM